MVLSDFEDDMPSKEVNGRISDADKNESQEMLKPVRGLWLIVSIVMFNLIPVLIHGGALPLTNFLIFNVYAIRSKNGRKLKCCYNDYQKEMTKIR